MPAVRRRYAGRIGWKKRHQNFPRFGGTKRYGFVMTTFCTRSEAGGPGGEVKGGAAESSAAQPESCRRSHHETHQTHETCRREISSVGWKWKSVESARSKRAIVSLRVVRVFRGSKPFWVTEPLPIRGRTNFAA